MRHTAAVLFTAVCLGACGGEGGTGPSSPSPQPPGGSAPGDTCSALGVQPSLAIVNGAECSPAASAVVLLNMRDRSGFAVGACSGTLIAPRAILTAAHCLDGDVAQVRVWLGSGNEIVADSFSFHRGYSQTSGSANDVGVVLMDDVIPRVPVPLLSSRDARAGESAVIAGWGRSLDSITGTLRAGRVTITTVGAAVIESQFNVTASSVCQGDSGGPLLVSEGGRWAIAGITSAASLTQCNAGTTFFTNVRASSVSSFILDNVPNAGGI